MTKNPWKALDKKSGVLKEGALADITVVARMAKRKGKNVHDFINEL